MPPVRVPRAASGVVSHSSASYLVQIINLTFCVVCIILLVRLLMAMMTNTFRTVHQKAQLEWRLLITRHVLRIELLGASLLGERLHESLFAGTKHPVDGRYYHNFLRIKLLPGEAHSMPIKFSQLDHEGGFLDDDPGTSVRRRAIG